MTHSYVWHDSFICVTWLIHMCDMTHSYVRHDSFVQASRTLLKFTAVVWISSVLRTSGICDMTHLYVWDDSFTRVMWLVYMCDKTHSFVRHDSFILVTWIIHFSIGMVWISSVQSGEDSQDALFWWVIFRKRALWLVALLRKMTCNLRYPMGLRHLVLRLQIYEMNGSHVWHDWFILWRNSFICVTQFIFMRGRTHSYTWRVWIVCVTRLIRLFIAVVGISSVLCKSGMWHDSFISETWPIHTCDTTHISQHKHDYWSGVEIVRHVNVWQDSFLCVTWLIPICVTWLIHKSRSEP